MRYSTLVIGALALLIGLAACTQPTAATTPVSPTKAVPTAVPPTPAPPPALTAGQLAVLGKSVYDRSCGMCHNSGPGPALSVWTRPFSNAQKLFDWMSKNMPKSAPGSLEPEEYFQVVSWVLVDQKVLAADAALDINQLAQVVIPK